MEKHFDSTEIKIMWGMWSQIMTPMAAKGDYEKCSSYLIGYLKQSVLEWI